MLSRISINYLKNTYQLIDNVDEDEHPFSVKVIDLITELRNGNNSFISSYLDEKLNEVITKDEQALLLVNNDTSYNYVSCRDCGLTLKCPRCNISYNYSEKNNQLICPSCGKREEFISFCPSCKSTRLHFGGVGKESIIKQLTKKISSERIVPLEKDDSFDTYIEKLNDIEEKSNTQTNASEKGVYAASISNEAASIDD